MFRSLCRGLGDLVYPPFCFACQSALRAEERPLLLCHLCLQSISWNRSPACPKCSRYLGPHPQTVLCSGCRRQKLYFDFAWSACLFEEPLRGLIHQFKFQERRFLYKLFSRMMLDFISRNGLDIGQFDILVPMPLSAAKYRERGYNQAQLLAAPIARAHRKLMLTSLLQRSRYTPSQTSLSRKNRFTNVRGSFRINPRVPITNKNILIIDDLLTTGASASEASFCLKARGAAKVGVLTLAIV